MKNSQTRPILITSDSPTWNNICRKPSEYKSRLALSNSSNLQLAILKLGQDKFNQAILKANGAKNA